MLFEDFDLHNVSDVQKNFIKNLSDMLENYDFPLLSIDNIKVTSKSEGEYKYLNVILPHKTEKMLDLTIGVDDREAIAYFADVHIHGDQFNESDDWTKDAVGFIMQILQGKFEAHVFHKGNKLVKEKIYYSINGGEKELHSLSKYLNFSSFNPFIKERKEIIEISFC